MSKTYTCISCKFCKVLDVDPGHGGCLEFRCLHPDYIDFVTGKGRFTCQRMRRKKIWFFKEGPCGPTAWLHITKTDD